LGVIDLQKKIIFWSDGAEQVTGYGRMEVLGRSCGENILPHCNQEQCEMCNQKCPLAVALHNARPVEAASFIHHKSGHQTAVHAWAIPLRNQHGSMIGLIQTFEGEVALNGPDPNDRSMKEHGCLDADTDLPNRPMMRSHLRENLSLFAEFKIPFGVVCLQVVELDGIRLRYGQEAATLLLQVLARTLRNATWPADFVGRWSESQFLVILCGCGGDAVQAVAWRMQRMISSASIMWWGEELTVTAGIGRAGAIPGDSAESIVQRAQQALVEGRFTPQNGQNRGAAASSARSPTS
jgi:diguanylate cyclase (GGDEF)-like protein/PAS domain S-box-containing protein